MAARYSMLSRAKNLYKLIPKALTIDNRLDFDDTSTFSFPNFNTFLLLTHTARRFSAAKVSRNDPNDFNVLEVLHHCIRGTDGGQKSNY